jgi:hypothetical protein
MLTGIRRTGRLNRASKAIGHAPRIAAILLTLSISAPAQDSAASIIRQSAEANDRDWVAAPEFDHSERDRNQNRDRTYAVTMLLGSPYERLIATNGHPLSLTEQEEEQTKYQDAVEKRQRESRAARMERIAKYEAERKRDHTLIEQMTTGFNFKLLGDKNLKGRRVYVLKATPRNGYLPPDRDSEVLTGMEGTLWIDHDTYQWVKVQAHVTRPVRIEGFIAEVEPGTQFEVEKAPVSGDIWLPTHFAMKSRAKILFFVNHSTAEDESYFDYHRPTSNARGFPPNQP